MTMCNVDGCYEEARARGMCARHFAAWVSGDEWHPTPNNIRSRIRNAILQRQASGETLRDLGMTVSEFQMYIASMFEPGMSWENYGEWHLDHIRPLASFDLRDKDQYAEAVHYTNYQPLWAGDNIRKGDRYG